MKHDFTHEMCKFAYAQQLCSFHEVKKRNLMASVIALYTTITSVFPTDQVHTISYFMLKDLQNFPWFLRRFRALTR